MRFEQDIDLGKELQKELELEKNWFEYVDAPNNEIGKDSFRVFIEGIRFSIDNCVENHPAIELGVRSGGTSGIILETIFKSSFPKRWLISIDPYGMLSYRSGMHSAQWSGMTYGNELYRTALNLLAEYSCKRSLNHLFLKMKDIDYFRFYNDGIDLYQNSKHVKCNKFSFIHLDAEHSIDAVFEQLKFFIPRSVENTVISIDDTNFDELSSCKKMIEEYLKASGFELWLRSHKNKRSNYRKVETNTQS